MADITLAQANALLKELRTEAATSNSKKSRGSTRDGKHALDLGLRIVANPSGTASFVYRAKINGKLKPIKLKDIGERITAADLEAARDAYRAARAEVIAGTDPAEKRRQAREAAAEEAAMVKAAQAEKAFTVRRLCDAYVEARSDEGSDNYRKSWRENQWYLETYLYPAIGDKPVSQVDVANCADILNGRASTPVLRNRLLATARGAWNWGIRETARKQLRVNGRVVSMVSFNPWALEQAVKEKPRSRVLSVGELRRLVQILQSQPEGQVRDSIELILLTGLRRNEVMKARRDEFDFEHHEWRIPAERMKNAEEHVVMMSRQVEAIVQRILNSHGSALLFPSPRSEDRYSDEYVGWRWLRKDVAPQFDRPFTCHDLRRSFASWAGEQHSEGMPLYTNETIDRCLAHKRRGIIAVYNQSRLNEPSRRLWLAWADFLDSLTDTKISPIGKRA